MTKKEQSPDFKSEDYYKNLGLSREATDQEIRQAYRDLAVKYHPDRNKEQDAKESFQKINEAYSVLGDYLTRREYDRYGKEGFIRSQQQ